MQTFLPYPNFAKSAAALDDLRLRKQILETAQVLDALRHNKGYVHHPMTIAWRGYEEALRLYGKAILAEYRRRGGVKYVEYEAHFGSPDPKAPLPPWVGDNAFHTGHRGHLYRKDAQKYPEYATWAETPLLYPCDGAFVERVVEGRFRPYPDRQDGKVYRSVKAARGLVPGVCA